MEKLLFRPSEAAEVLGISRSKLYELLAEGAVPSVRVGNCIRLPADALRRWVKTRRLRIQCPSMRQPIAQVRSFEAINRDARLRGRAPREDYFQ